MVAHSIAQGTQHSGIRRFEIQHDLPQLADLIEVAFQAELERTGNRIVTEMRQLAHIGPLLWLLGASHSALPHLMSGHVWIENGRLVGNATLSLGSRRRGLWSISNVAVHPGYRGRGIAQKLVEASLQEADDRGAQLIILEVQTANPPAQRLYGQLGFEVYDTVAELSLPAQERPKQAAPPPLPLRKRRPDDWQGLYNLFKATTPAKAQKVRPILAYRYRLSLERRLELWFDDLLHFRRHSDWILEKKGKIVAFLELTGHYRQAAHRLQITVRPKSRGAVEEALLAAGLDSLSRFPAREVGTEVSASHPEAQRAFYKAGFQTVRVLDQMWLDLQHGEGRSML